MGRAGRRNKFWVVLATKSLSGKEAAVHVSRQGFEVYRPLYRAPPLLKIRKVASLFPGYIFARVTPENWKPLASTRDVRRVLMSRAETPSRVNDIEIERLRSLENIHGFIEPEFASPPGFVAGESVEAKRGIFKDQFGKFVGLADQRGGHRVRVLFELLGQPYTHEISAFDLAKVAA